MNIPFLGAVLRSILDAGGYRIKNIGAPVEGGDAVTKEYMESYGGAPPGYQEVRTNASTGAIHAADPSPHVTAAQKAAWDAKQDALTNKQLENIEDVTNKLAKMDVVAPSSSAKTGQAADANATGEALGGKRDYADLSYSFWKGRQVGLLFIKGDVEAGWENAEWTLYWRRASSGGVPAGWLLTHKKTGTSFFAAGEKDLSHIEFYSGGYLLDTLDLTAGGPIALVSQLSGITSQDITDFLRFRGVWKEGVRYYSDMKDVVEYNGPYYRAEWTGAEINTPPLDRTFVYAKNDGKTGLEKLLDLFGEQNSQLANTIREKVLADGDGEIKDYLFKDTSFGGGSSSAPEGSLSKTVADIKASARPNITVVGSPTINGGSVSGFSAANYLVFPSTVDIGNATVDFDLTVQTGAQVTTQENILDSWCGLALAIENGQWELAVSTNGTTFTNVQFGGTVTANTPYRLRISFSHTLEGGHLVTLRESDGEGGYGEAIISMALAAHIFPKPLYFGGANPQSGVPHVFGGVINIGACSMTFNGTQVWNGWYGVVAPHKHKAEDIADPASLFGGDAFKAGVATALDEHGAKEKITALAEAASRYKVVAADKDVADRSIKVYDLTVEGASLPSQIPLPAFPTDGVIDCEVWIVAGATAPSDVTYGKTIYPRGGEGLTYEANATTIVHLTAVAGQSYYTAVAASFKAQA